MSESLSISGIKYIPAAQAGKRFGYTKEYILLLAREGKITAERVGRRWYVEPTSIETFFKRAHEVRKVRSESIRKVRKAELAHHEFSRNRGHHKTALLQTLAILVIGLAVGATGYLGTTVTQTASVQEAGSSFFERLAVALYTFVVPQESITTESVQLVNSASSQDQNDSAATTSVALSAPVDAETAASFSALVVAPEAELSSSTIASIRGAFSDEVSITIDEGSADTGIVVPRFKSRDGEAYRFLLAPIEVGSAPETATSNGSVSSNSPSGG